MQNITKIILLVVFFLAQTFALEPKDYENIAKYYEDKFNDNGVKIKVRFKEKLTHTELPFETLLLEFTQGDFKSVEPVFIKDNYVFTDFVDFKNQKSYKDLVSKIIKEKLDYEMIAKLKEKNNFITLGSGDKNVYIFFDPNCPHCKKHLESLNESYLKKHKLHIIPVGLLNFNSLLKSIAINKELSLSKKSDAEILKILKSYYEKDKVLTQASEKELKNAKEQMKLYKSLGLSYVPYIIEEEKK